MRIQPSRTELTPFTTRFTLDDWLDQLSDYPTEDAHDGTRHNKNKISSGHSPKHPQAGAFGHWRFCWKRPSKTAKLPLRRKQSLTGTWPKGWRTLPKAVPTAPTNPRARPSLRSSAGRGNGKRIRGSGSEGPLSTIATPTISGTAAPRSSRRSQKNSTSRIPASLCGRDSERSPCP
jgi:hypothetical protein